MFFNLSWIWSKKTSVSSFYKENNFKPCLTKQLLNMFKLWCERDIRKHGPKNYAFAYHICRSWYNGSYTMMAKPMKTLQLHYPMIQFLIISDIPQFKPGNIRSCDMLTPIAGERKYLTDYKSGYEWVTSQWTNITSSGRGGSLGQKCSVHFMLLKPR